MSGAASASSAQMNAPSATPTSATRPRSTYAATPTPEANQMIGGMCDSRSQVCTASEAAT